MAEHLSIGAGNQIERIVVSAEQLARRVQALAEEIAARYAGKELTILAVLTGSLIFLADLIRRLPLRVRLDVVCVRSYPGPAMQSQGPQLLSPLQAGLSGKDVLIVDDILDSGLTLRAVLAAASALAPASLGTCVLLRKARTEGDERIRPDFVGFEVGPEFLVGYGLDFDGLYRNLPDIRVLRPNGRGAGKGDKP